MSYKICLLIIITLATSYACLYNGKIYLDGQEWVERNTFLMKCHIKKLFSWYVDIVACLTPSQAKIPVGKWLAEGRYNYSCYTKEKGIVWIKYDPIVNGTSLGKNGNGNGTLRCEGKHEIGTRWREWQFLFECSANATKSFIGCITETGLFVPVNQTAVSGGLTFVCRQYPNGTATFHGAKLVRTPLLKEGNTEKEGITKNLKNCIDFNNGTRNIGEYWIEKENFNMTCSADGKLSLVNCLFANQTAIGNFSCELYTDTRTFINHTKVVELNETESNLNHTLV